MKKSYQTLWLACRYSEIYDLQIVSILRFGILFSWSRKELRKEVAPKPF
jgi:hypothetical protein